MKIKFGTLIFKHKKTGAKLTCKDNVFVGDNIKDVNEYDKITALNSQGITIKNREMYELVDIGKFKKVNS